MKINDDALRAAAEAALPQIKCFFRWEIKDALSESHKNELELQVAISFAMPAILAYLSSLPEHAQSLDISAGHTQESEKNEHMSALPGPAQEGDSINPSVSTAPSHVDDKNVGGVPGEEGLVKPLDKTPLDKGQAKCRGCGLILEGNEYCFGGPAYHPRTGKQCPSNFYGGYVCSESCDYRATLDLEQSMPGHGYRAKSVSQQASRHIAKNWRKHEY